VGLICLSPENIEAPWILFEAGALSKTLENTFVCPYLLDLRPADILQSPLVQFQATVAEKEDTRKLLHTINKAVAGVENEQELPEAHLNEGFEMWWPKLYEQLQAIQSLQSQSPRKPSEREVLEEILEGVRGLTRHLSSDLSSIAAIRQWDKELVLSGEIALAQRLEAAKKRALASRLREPARPQKPKGGDATNV